MPLLTSATHPGVEQAARESGALSEVEAALAAAYTATAGSASGRLNPSSAVVRELRSRGWISGRVWAPAGLPKEPNDQFDGWKRFGPENEGFGVAVEVEWSWNRVYFDLLKFWRAATGGQIDFGIEVLRGPSAFAYAIQHQYRLYAELIPDVRILFCALDAPDLRDPEYEAAARNYGPFPMP